MAQLIYRGVPVQNNQEATQTLADQMRRPTLIYRGVEHDGERAIKPQHTKREDLVYRGVRLA